MDFLKSLLNRFKRKASATMDQKLDLIKQLITDLNRRIEQLQLKELEEEIWLEEAIAKEERQKPLPIAIKREEETTLAIPEILRLEVNRLKFPIFVLDDKDVKRRKSIEYRVVVKRNGQKLEVGWQVGGHTMYGLPGRFEKRIDLAIQERINEMEPPISNPVMISTFELCKKMGERPGGFIYKKIHQGLQRLVSTTITSEGIFYAKDKKQWVSDTFHLYDRVVLRGEHLPSGKIADRNYIWLSQFFLDNINYGYTKPLSLPLYKKLHSPIAQRLYEFLGVKFYGVLNAGGTFYNIAYRELCQLLPLTPQREHKYAKRQLKKAHEELIAVGYLKEVKWDNWVIYYFPGPKAKKEHEESKEAESPFRLKAGTSPEKEVEIEGLVREMAMRLGDGSFTRDGQFLSKPRNLGFYYHIARRVPAEIIRMCLRDTEMAEREGRIETSKAQVFTGYLKASCQAHGIELDLKSQEA